MDIISNYVQCAWFEKCRRTNASFARHAAEKEPWKQRDAIRMPIESIYIILTAFPLSHAIYILSESIIGTQIKRSSVLSRLLLPDTRSCSSGRQAWIKESETKVYVWTWVGPSSRSNKLAIRLAHCRRIWRLSKLERRPNERTDDPTRMESREIYMNKNGCLHVNMFVWSTHTHTRSLLWWYLWKLKVNNSSSFHYFSMRPIVVLRIYW